MSYYNYRYYSSEHGCWLQRDPQNEKFGINLYNYVNNAPISLWDILGELFSQNQQEPEIYVQEDIVFTPNTNKGCSKCNRELLSLTKKNSERYYSAQREQFASKIRCKLEVTCGCTRWGTAAGEHQPNFERTENGYIIRSGKIVIPCNATGMRNTFIHELTHAVDYCKLGIPTTCQQLLFTEFNAYSSERCSNAKDYKGCLLTWQ